MIDLEHLRKRKLFQWTIAYLAAAWLILQLLDLLADTYPSASGIPRIALPLLAVGLLAALVIAWYHGEKGAQRVGGMEILMLAGILVIAGAAVGFLARGGRGAATGGGETGPAGAPAGVAAEQNSIAVLPFVNMSGDTKQEYFADGLTEELLNVLAQLPELRVASRTSAFAFKGQEVGIDSIAKALRVAHVLEGSVRQAGQRVKITAQLIDAKSGYHLWSDTYERDYQDIFRIQEDISRAIVDALKLRLAGGRADSALSVPETGDPEAHRLVLEGMAAMRDSNQGSLRRALDCFRQALARDPDYLPAREQLARVTFNMAYRSMVPADQGFLEARREAERVLALDPGSASAHVTLGQIANLYDWDPAKAEAHFRQALERNPNSADAHGALGDILVRLGQPEQGIAEARRAAEIDPLSAPAQNRLGAVCIYTRHYEEGIVALRNALALTPDASTSLGNLALAYAAFGRLPDALQLAERAAAIDSTDTFVLSVLGYVYGQAGRRADAERVLRIMEETPGAAFYDRASINLALGHTDEVFRLLEKALAIREQYLMDLPIDPLYDPLRGDPRMKRLVARIGPR